MDTIPTSTIVQWCGISTTTTRKRIIDDMTSPTVGLKQHNSETSEEMLGTFMDQACHDAVDENIIFTRVQQRRLISLMDWVKDKTCLEEEASFPDRTTRQKLTSELEEATTTKKCIK